MGDVAAGNGYLSCNPIRDLICNCMLHAVMAQVFIATADGWTPFLKDWKSKRFATAFSSPSTAAAAEELWQQLGRAGPPLFLKVRTRQALDDLEVGFRV